MLSSTYMLQHIVNSFGLLLSSVFLCARKIQDIQSHTFHIRIGTRIRIRIRIRLLAVEFH